MTLINSKVLIILGMHRSGTSLTANWLYEMGFPLGESLMPAAASNKKGHYEDLDFFQFHKDILDKNELEYYTSDRDKIIISEEDRSKAEQLIQEKSKLSQWGWKDPRTCLFAEFWDDLLRKKGLSPKYLLVYRPVEQVVDSLVRRDIVEKKSNPNVLKRWLNLRRYQKSLKALQKQYLNSWILHLSEMKKIYEKSPNDCVIIRADEIIDIQKVVYSQLSEQWNLTLHFVDVKEIYEKDQFARLDKISKYGNDEIQDLHDFFSRNRLKA